jgi:predicted Zn finger-like uncharacterized protein
MDVRCDRCSTEYEFDDALVSERGTTVKCTNCGFQFKVFRRTGGSTAPDRWLVHAQDGRDLIFLSLRELQRAILARQVLPTNMLTRSGSEPRTLGSIPELTPFFETAAGKKTLVGISGLPAPRTPLPTPKGLGAVAYAQLPPPQTPPPPRVSPSMPADQTAPFAISKPPSSSRAPAMPKITNSAAVTLTQAPTLAQIRDEEPQTIPVQNLGLSPDADPLTLQRPSTVPPPSVRPRNRERISEDGMYTPTPSAEVRSSVVSSYRNSTDEPFSESIPGLSRHRPGVGRWIIGIGVVGALAVVAMAFVKKWGGEQPQKMGTGNSVTAPDLRVQTLIKQGQEALDEGDLDSANDAFVKASALAANDQRVLLGLAKIMTQRADYHWLRLKILPASAKEARSVAETQLKKSSNKAVEAAEKANKTQENDVESLAIKADALRLTGKLKEAREIAPKLAPKVSQGPIAYVLAMLDLSEDSPSYPTVLQRLKVAASAEKVPGRARAALVYALAKSGDKSAAISELQPMLEASKLYPLVPELKEMVGVTSETDKKGANEKSDAGTKDGPGKTTGIGTPPPTTTPTTTTGSGVGTAPTATATKKKGEFSEDELNTKLPGGGKTVTITKTVKTVEPGDKPATPPPPPPEPKKPPIDTTDLPGVKAPTP